MINFISVSVRNFLSYGNNVTTIRLDRPGTTLILGEDLDHTANGQGGNGCGKTTIINALAYGVYGKPVSNISLDNLVNNTNKKNMEVTVTFEKNGTFYHIQRVRRSKNYAAGNYVKLYRNNRPNFTDAHEITLDSVANTNKLIEEIINVTHELFVRIVTYSATHTPFLDLPVRHPTAPCQTKIIEGLFQLTDLAEDAEALKDRQRITNRALEILKVQIEHLEKEHERYNQQLSSARRRVDGWNQTNKDDIVKLESKLKKIIDVDIKEQQQVHNQLKKIDNDLTKVTELQHKCKDDIDLYVEKMKTKEEELTHLRDERCPYCLQSFADADKKIAECEKAVSQYKELIDEFTDNLKTYEDHSSKLTKEHKKIEKQITVSNIDELLNIQNESASIQQQIKKLREAVNPFIEPLEELESLEPDPITYDEVNELTKQLEHQKFLYKLLTKKDSFVRKALLNKNIPFLNSRLQEYLNKLGLPHTVEFTHELTTEISQFGRPLDFGNLSNGQRARVNIALSFAFRDVLQKLHTRINVCLLDEVLDVGLDTVGVQMAARMLKRKARDEGLSLFIISHRDEVDSAFEHNMIVQMSKGFSHIKESYEGNGDGV